MIYALEMLINHVLGDVLGFHVGKFTLKGNFIVKSACDQFHRLKLYKCQKTYSRVSKHCMVLGVNVKCSMKFCVAN